MTLPYLFTMSFEEKKIITKLRSRRKFTVITPNQRVLRYCTKEKKYKYISSEMVINFFASQ